MIYTEKKFKRLKLLFLALLGTFASDNSFAMIGSSTPNSDMRKNTNTSMIIGTPNPTTSNIRREEKIEVTTPTNQDNERRGETVKGSSNTPLLYNQQDYTPKVYNTDYQSVNPQKLHTFTNSRGVVATNSGYQTKKNSINEKLDNKTASIVNIPKEGKNNNAGDVSGQKKVEMMEVNKNILNTSLLKRVDIQPLPKELINSDSKSAKLPVDQNPDNKDAKTPVEQQNPNKPQPIQGEGNPKTPVEQNNQQQGQPQPNGKKPADGKSDGLNIRLTKLTSDFQDLNEKIQKKEAEKKRIHGDQNIDKSVQSAAIKDIEANIQSLQKQSKSIEDQIQEIANKEQDQLVVIKIQDNYNKEIALMHEIRQLSEKKRKLNKKIIDIEAKLLVTHDNEDQKILQETRTTTNQEIEGITTDIREKNKKLEEIQKINQELDFEVKLGVTPPDYELPEKKLRKEEYGSEGYSVYILDDSKTLPYGIYEYQTINFAKNENTTNNAVNSIFSVFGEDLVKLVEQKTGNGMSIGDLITANTLAQEISKKINEKLKNFKTNIHLIAEKRTSMKNQEASFNANLISIKKSYHAIIDNKDMFPEDVLSNRVLLNVYQLIKTGTIGGEVKVKNNSGDEVIVSKVSTIIESMKNLVDTDSYISKDGPIHNSKIQELVQRTADPNFHNSKPLKDLVEKFINLINHHDEIVKLLHKNAEIKAQYAVNKALIISFIEKVVVYIEDTYPFQLDIKSRSRSQLEVLIKAKLQSLMVSPEKTKKASVNEYNKTLNASVQTIINNIEEVFESKDVKNLFSNVAHYNGYVFDEIIKQLKSQLGRFDVDNNDMSSIADIEKAINENSFFKEMEDLAQNLDKIADGTSIAMQKTMEKCTNSSSNDGDDKLHTVGDGINTRVYYSEDSDKTKKDTKKEKDGLFGMTQGETIVAGVGSTVILGGAATLIILNNKNSNDTVVVATGAQLSSLD